jgi:predicted phage terminase large subunit-like protein
MYATATDLHARMQARLIAELSGSDDGEPVAVRVDQALADAAAEIDSYLAARFAVPVAPVPGVLIRLACDIAIYRLFETAREDADRYGNTVHVWGEQEGGSAGKEISEQFVKMLAGYPVHRDIVSGKGTKLIQGLELPHKPKIIRSQGLVAQSEAGNVRVKRAPWTGDFLDELVMFPESDICDQVDAASGALNKLCRMWTTDPGFTGRIETVADGERFGVHLDKIGNQTGHRR